MYRIISLAAIMVVAAAAPSIGQAAAAARPAPVENPLGPAGAPDLGSPNPDLGSPNLGAPPVTSRTPRQPSASGAPYGQEGQPDLGSGVISTPAPANADAGPPVTDAIPPASVGVQANAPVAASRGGFTVGMNLIGRTGDNLGRIVAIARNLALQPVAITIQTPDGALHVILASQLSIVGQSAATTDTAAQLAALPPPQ